MDDEERDAWLAAWAVVLLLLGANAARPLTLTQRARARKLLRVAFEDSALRLAQRVGAGQLSVDEWRSEVEGVIAAYARQQAVAGAGTLPPAPVQQMAAQEIQRQQDYLNGFMAAVAAGTLSIGAIAARTKLYGAGGWHMHWVGQGSTAPDYAVEVWRARDDRATCSICSSLNGRYFLPGQGEMPGASCLGAGNCRCERVQVIDRAIWERLTGRRAAQWGKRALTHIPCCTGSGSANRRRRIRPGIAMARRCPTV